MTEKDFHWGYMHNNSSKRAHLFVYKNRIEFVSDQTDKSDITVKVTARANVEDGNKVICDILGSTEIPILGIYSLLKSELAEDQAEEMVFALAALKYNLK